MKIRDCHIHIFNEKIVRNVVDRTELCERLHLNTHGIEHRLDTHALTLDMEAAGVMEALMLPTADVAGVAKVNRSCLKLARETPGLLTAGTLHPDLPDKTAELTFLNRSGVRILKMCSFSQRFPLNGANTHAMFEMIEAVNRSVDRPFAVLLDTLTLSDRYFGSDPDHTTTPEGLHRLVRRFPGINFIGAHMGGLGAPFATLRRFSIPRDNFYLDTSNAAHTLTEVQFAELLKTHGPRHILFGTDWPWFTHETEVPQIAYLMDKAGFSSAEKQAVFYDNLTAMLDS